jgi:hypothetical protein
MPRERCAIGIVAVSARHGESSVRCAAFVIRVTPASALRAYARRVFSSAAQATSRATMADDPARAALRTAIAELGETPEQVSLAIDMPQDYLCGFLERGVPPVLPARLRRRLAQYLGVPEFCLSD